MTPKSTAAEKRNEKATAEAAILVARAFAMLKEAGHKNPVDGLAVACTNAVQGEGACLIPVTVKDFKPFLSRPGSAGALPNGKARVSYIASIFEQRRDAAIAVLNGVWIWDETGSVATVQFKD